MCFETVRRGGGWLAVLVCAALAQSSAAAFGEQLQPGSAAGEGTGQIPLSKTPAAQMAPPPIRQLIEEGDVSVEFVSQPALAKAKRGKALFHLGLKHHFSYRYVTSRQGGQTIVKVTLKRIELKLTLRHTIRLPLKYDTPRVWHSRLGRHEFDHVAISVDPRPRMILKYLCEHLPPVERTLAPEQKPSKELYRQFVSDELEKRLNAVIALVQHNYELLDAVTRHGAVPVPQRPDFFARLFTEANLVAMEFPYLEEVSPLLSTREFQNASLKFPAIDPTQRR